MGSGLTKYQSLEAAKPDDNSCLDSVFTVSMTDVLCELTAVTYNRLQSLQTRHFLIIYDIPDYVDRTIEVIDRYFRNSLVDKCGVKADDIKINIPLKSIPSSGEKVITVDVSNFINNVTSFNHPLSLLAKSQRPKDEEFLVNELRLNVGLNYEVAAITGGLTLPLECSLSVVLQTILVANSNSSSDY